MKTLFKEKTLSIVLRSILLGCPILVAPHTFAAATNYQTEEFKANWGLNSIGAHHAYEKGYTGKGVAIGVSDSDFPAGIHELINNLTFVAPNKKGKEHDASLVIGNDVTNDFDPAKYKHGAHVSGIIAGQKDNIGMHGVAYGSKLFVQNMANNIYPLIDGTSVRVINNSWGTENDAHYGIDANNPKYADLTGIDGKTQFNLRDYKEANSKNRPLEFLEKVLDKQTGITIKDAVDATTDTIFVGGVRYDVKNDKSRVC
ncbi:hypothetical protein A6M14_07610 [Acinetobacter sp. Ac_877]|uniref:S8 family serine peptidase n=1 Tax=Acinetobacter portensis TaxID=1839785 RepID=UPI00128BE3DF|nr:S8 family serine peptidase [Acinetobacter portensis]MPW41249.1 hypothetical protein [Acinetobacter portensis]